MAQSYTRQSTFADGDTISASLFNNEYNQLVNSFAYSSSSSATTGHRHDGTAGQGGNIPKIGDLDFFNKIEVDSTNNRWGFYVEVSSAAVEQIRIQDGAIVPVTDNDIDLGTSSLQFKDLFINGTANIDSLVLSSGSTVTAILDEDGLTSNSATSLATQQSIKAYVDAQVTAQDLDFSADSGGALSIDLDSESLTFTGGTGIDTSGLGNAVTFAIDSTVATLTGSQTLTNKTLTSPDINGGTVDGATIATSDITVGAGKTLDVSAGTLTLADNQISGDKVEGGTIAATTITDLTFGSLNDGVITVTAFVDEDNMASDSNTLVPTQQSVKAYVDSQVTAQDLDFQADTGGALSIDLDSETFTFTGGTGIDTSGALNAVTFAIDSTVATLTGTQTLSNKTLATPVVSGNLTTDGLIDGRDVATDGVKLDGIEASADVTDTTNVTAAGALMDSEVTNLAQVKAFDSSDYATAAQGTTADAALPRTGGAMTGAITTNSTFDGRDVATDGAKLDGIEASADVTDTANVTAAGALMDSELTSEASVKALDQGVATTDSPSFTNLTLNGTGSVKVPAGTTAQRDGSPVAGMFRYNSSLSQFEGYTDAWGAIGGGGTNTFTTDSFTGDGTTVAYALSQAVSSEDNLLVFIEGVFQQQDAYSIATAGGVTTLTFSAAPANGNSILIYSVAAGVSGSNLNIDSMTGDGSDTTLTLTINPVNENNTQVFIDGVYQNKSTYSISGTTLTFSTAPPNGSAVEVMTMTQTDINVPVDNSITSAKLSGDLVTPGNLDVTGTVTADKLVSANGVLELDDNGTHNGIINAPASLFINIDSDNNNTGEDFVISKDRTGTSGGTELFRVQEDGNCGIGTSSPSQKLDVSGNISMSGAGTGSRYLILGNETNTYAGSLVLQAGGGSAGFGGAIIAYGHSHASKAGDIVAGISSGSGGAFRVNTSGVDDGSDVLVVEASGNVGIGTISPTYKIDATTTSGGNGLKIARGSGSFFEQFQTTTGGVSLAASGSGAFMAFRTGTTAGTTTERMRIDSSGGVIFKGALAAHQTNAGTAGYESNIFTLRAYGATAGTGEFRVLTGGGGGSAASEAMRIDSSGNLLVGLTSISDATSRTYGNAFSGSASYANWTSWGSGTHTNAAFRNGTNQVGSIVTTSTTTTYNTSSDQRLKENIVDAPSASDDIDAIQVRSFDWKADGSHQKYGMVAQELQGVVPEAVTGDADSDEMMGVDYSKLVPMMIKEIQSLRREVAALKENN